MYCKIIRFSEMPLTFPWVHPLNNIVYEQRSSFQVFMFDLNSNKFQKWLQGILVDTFVQLWS